MENIRPKIIIVDDSPINLDICRNMLKACYEAYPAPSVSKLFEILDNVIPDLILLDIDMPETNGFEAIKELKATPCFSDIPVIFLSAHNDADTELEGFDLGAMDYIIKPFSGPLLLKRIANQLLIIRQKKELLASRAALQDYANTLEEKIRLKTLEVLRLQNAVLSTVADLVECRDGYTGTHISRTQLFLGAMIRQMRKQQQYTDEISKWDIDIFLASAQLHDVGKIAIPDRILNKPGKLTDEEFDIMKTHVTVGVAAIEKIMDTIDQHSFLHHAWLIAGTHHEKWDGTGYPRGLSGKNIPLEGCLMAIVDVYDALISDRPYKKAFTHEQAREIIIEGAGTHFDPALVEIFLNAEDDFVRIAQLRNA